MRNIQFLLIQEHINIHFHFKVFQLFTCTTLVVEKFWSSIRDCCRGNLSFNDARVEVVLAKDSLKILDVYIKQEGDYTIDLGNMIELKLLLEANVL